jgi:hypothetical protein
MKFLNLLFGESAEPHSRPAHEDAMATQNQWQNQALLPPIYPEALLAQEQWTDPRTNLTWERESVVGDWVVGQFHEGQTCIRAEAPREILEAPGYQSWYESFTGDNVESVASLPTPGYQACYDQGNQLTASGTFDSASPMVDPWPHFVNDVIPTLATDSSAVSE